MKKFLASVVVALAAFPLAAFACDGGVDCSAIQPAPQPAPPPTTMESLSNTLSDNSGLVAGLLIGGAVIGYVISRRPKGLQPKGAAGYRDERVTPGYFVFTALKLFASR